MVKSKNIYQVPIDKKDRILVISDPRAHSGVLKHSIDFLIPVGTEIHTAQDGKVIAVKVDSKSGGSEDKYDDEKYLNFIHIKHKNNEFTEYAHLKHNGSFVKVGQRVTAGETIGLSGNTGYTTAPHLHFHVFKKTSSKIGWETLEIRFEQPLNIKRENSDFTEEDYKMIEKISRYPNK